MRFAHMADSHIGGWRNDRINQLSLKSFSDAIDTCISRKVDFILMSGDLFNSSVPSLDNLRYVVKHLKLLKDRQIPFYLIAGSHDFSPSGKTILDVLEEAGLCTNVVKADRAKTKETGKLVLRFTMDEKTGAKITGILGKKGMLDRIFYEGLDRENLESEEGFRVFMFHTALTELKPKELARMPSSPVSFLPKGFNYYAGGHVHIVKDMTIPGYRNIVYPGPLFPNNFAELEKLGTGGFYIYDDGNLSFVSLDQKKTVLIDIDAENKSSEQVENDLRGKIKDFEDLIVLIRVQGILETGRPSDINFRDIVSRIYSKGAYTVMRNISKLKSKQFKDIYVQKGSVEEIETELISKHKNEKSPWQDDEKMVHKLMTLLDSEKKEDERNYDYEERIIRELNNLTA